MPIVKCPSCATRYDPGVDADVAGLPENLAIKVVCPSCGQWVRLPEQEPVAPPDVTPEVLAEMAKQSKIVPADDAPKPIRTSRDEDDEPRSRRSSRDDDESPRSSRRRNEDDDDDRPRRSRSDYDDEDDLPRGRDDRGSYRDDYDDEPRRKKGDGFGITAMILGIASCVVALVGCCCLLIDGVSLLAAIAAVIFGFIGRSQNPESKTAMTGIILGFVGIALSILIVILGLAVNLGNLANR